MGNDPVDRQAMEIGLDAEVRDPELLIAFAGFGRVQGQVGFAGWPDSVLRYQPFGWQSSTPSKSVSELSGSPGNGGSACAAWASAFASMEACARPAVSACSISCEVVCRHATSSSTRLARSS
jgi:hypothetical protein